MYDASIRQSEAAKDHKNRKSVWDRANHQAAEARIREIGTEKVALRSAHHQDAFKNLQETAKRLRSDPRIHPDVLEALRTTERWAAEIGEEAERTNWSLKNDRRFRLESIKTNAQTAREVYGRINPSRTSRP